MPATNKRFIAYDETAIFGSGTTPEQALADVRRRNNATRRTEIAELPERSLETAPATAALIQEFEERGSQLARGELSDGTHCTLDEANDAERDGRA